MNAVDYILDGLEKELELERELGVRAVEFDRSLLTAASPVASQVSSLRSGGSTVDVRRETRDVAVDVRRETQDDKPGNFDFLFLHDRALSPKGVEMIAKIVVALGRTAETAPVVIVPPVPKAKVYVVLGGLALKKFFPALKGGPGQWLKTESGADVLVTYSPEYILRFPTVTPAVMKMKKDMWASLKSVLHRI